VALFLTIKKNLKFTSSVFPSSAMELAGDETFGGRHASQQEQTLRLDERA
jgi:hypothetical protein